MQADDVANARFRPTKWREGYDQGQVDDLLDRIEATLRSGEQAAGTAHEATMARFASTSAAPSPGPVEPVTPEVIVSSRFSPTRFRDGYDQNQVDDFLDRVVDELLRRGER